jgi:hypothetical protein
VLVRLKARLLDNFGQDVFQVVKLLSFDTADESYQTNNSRGEPIRLGKNTELISISNVPVPGILANLDLHPTIKSWVPKNLPAAAVTAGAKMVRPLGRLSFFFHYNVIRDRIQTAIEQVTNMRVVGKIGENITVSDALVMNVFIVSSVSGGTGSGTFIDAAFLARKLSKVDNTYVTGILVLPEAFSRVKDERVRANAYAALRELDYYMTSGDLSVEYVKGQRMDALGVPLFNICYLVDAVNERGKNLSSIPELAPMIAEAIVLQIGSQVGKENDSRFDNVERLHVPDETGAMRHYSGMGLASISLPAEEIITVCANRLGSELISKEFLAKRAAEEEVEGVLREFLATSQLERESLLVELSRSRTNRQALTVQLQEGTFANLREEEQLPQIQAYISKVENQDLNTQFKLALDENRRQLAKLLAGTIESAIIRTIDNPELGIHAAKKLIEAVGEHMEKMTSSLNQDVRARTEGLNKLNAQVGPAWQALGEATQSFALGRKGRVREARQHYFQLQQQRFTNQFEISKRNTAIALMADLGVALSEQKRRVDTLEDKLSITRSQFESAIANTTVARERRDSPLSYDITTQDDVDSYYKEQAQNLGESRTQLAEQRGSISSWLDRGQDEIRNFILSYGYGVFEPLREKRIEEVIIAKQRERSPEERLQDLRRDSVPFWSYNRALMPGGGNDMTPIVSIGVENKDTSIYRDQNLPGEGVTSTQDPHSVTVLNTKHGLPLYALQQYDHYRQLYKTHIQQRNASPLQLFSHINISDDEGEREARQAYALAEAFGFITSTGANMYRLRRADELSPPVELGRGLDTSVQNFASQTELVHEVRSMIDARMNDIGRNEAIKVISAYAAPGPNVVNPSPRDLLIIELKKLARDFAEELKK